jgi:hypothetical protein
MISKHRQHLFLIATAFEAVSSLLEEAKFDIPIEPDGLPVHRRFDPSRSASGLP